MMPCWQSRKQSAPSTAILAIVDESNFAEVLREARNRAFTMNRASHREQLAWRPSATRQQRAQADPRSVAPGALPPPS